MWPLSLAALPSAWSPVSRSLISCSLWASPTGNHSARLRAGRTHFPFLLAQPTHLDAGPEDLGGRRHDGVRREPKRDQGHGRPEPYLSHLHVESCGYGGIPGLPAPGPGSKGPGPLADSLSAL